MTDRRKPPAFLREGRPANAKPGRGQARTAAKRSRKPAKTKVSRAKKRSRFKLVGLAFRGLVLAGFVGMLAWVVLVFLFVPKLPDTGTLFAAQPRPGVTFIAADGEVIARRGAYQSGRLDLAQVSPFLVQAVLATEDRRFYDHFGVDVRGMLRALAVNFWAGRVVQGGSTISQQLAKNLYLTHERSFDRKIRELIIAIWLESRLSKDEILELYLNTVYLGAGAYGVESASQRYFGKSAAQLDLSEAALLAGLLKAPSRYNPTNDLEAAQTRAGVVLAAMVDAGFIPQDAANAGRGGPALPVQYADDGSAGYFLDWATTFLPEAWETRGENLNVVTTMDPDLQEAAATALKAIMSAEGPPRNARQAALVAIDFDGQVRALVGGTNYRKAPFNRVTEAKRQPGSAFKPVVYLAALQAGWRPGSQIVDGPITIKNWTPQNYDNKFKGEMSLRQAFAESRNTVAVKLLEDVGRKRVVSTAKLLGIKENLPAHPSLALGSVELTLLDLTTAFVPMANGGRAVDVVGVKVVRDDDGEVLAEHSTAPGAPFLSREVLGGMQDMLRSTVAWGTGKRADPGDRWVGGKTGTSQGWRDAWFIGFSRDLVVGVWVGNDDNSSMDKVTGGSLPAEIFAQFMRQTPRPSEPEPIVASASSPAAETATAARTAPEPAPEPQGMIDSALGWLQRQFDQPSESQVRLRTSD